MTHLLLCNLWRRVKWFFQIDDDAFADEWVEYSLGISSELRCFHDVPHEQLVIRLHRFVFVISRANCTLQPPIRCMECVGMMRGIGTKTSSRQPFKQHTAAIDANVSAFDPVIFVRQRPVDEFWSKAWNRDGNGATGLQQSPRCLLADAPRFLRQ